MDRRELFDAMKQELKDKYMQQLGSLFDLFPEFENERGGDADPEDSPAAEPEKIKNGGGRVKGKKKGGRVPGSKKCHGCGAMFPGKDMMVSEDDDGNNIKQCSTCYEKALEEAK